MTRPGSHIREADPAVNFRVDPDIPGLVEEARQVSYRQGNPVDRMTLLRSLLNAYIDAEPTKEGGEG